MTIFKVTVKVKRERFMEPPLHFTQVLHIIADDYDQALKYARSRMIGNGNEEEDIRYERLENEIMALFDVREGDEKIIV
ncbi:MAG: hypothetical protein J6U01_05465 [Clostridia bacterium]|nr:hypothetical protein [Clostridia bacterium]